MKKRIIVLLFISSAVLAQNKGYNIKNSFSAGELSPLLQSREDLAKFNSGCLIMENMIPLPQGAAQKRPGTKYAAESKENTKIRLLPFVYSTSPENSYIIELGNQYARFFKDNAVINDSVGTETLTAGSIVAHYKLNEDEGATVIDADGATHNMTASTDCSNISVTGKVSYGFDLDGQYDAALADADAWSFTDNANDTAFSIACWVYIEAQKEMQTILSKWRDDATTQEWRLSVDSSRKLQLHLADSSADLASARVAHWKLNEDAANKTILDDDATSHDGATQTDNTDVLTATGKVDKCIDFGGADYITITNDHDELSFGDGTDDSPFSISAWINPSEVTSTQIILGKYDATAGAELREWQLFLAGGQIQIRLYDESVAGTTIANGASTAALITAGMWWHVVGTYGGTGGSAAGADIKIYVNNVDVTSGTGYTSSGYVAMENLATKVIIGAGTNGLGNIGYYFSDKIDNVILFNTELTAGGVSSLWNDGNGTETLASTNATCYSVADDALDIGWRHVALSYSAPADETAAADGIIFYVDGSAVDSTATNNASYTAMQNGAEEIRIGSQRNAGDTANENFWGSRIDNISVYSDVLTPAEVAAMYSTTPYEIETPFLTADLYGIQYEQSADVLFLTHPDYETRKLIRYADVIWAMPVLGGISGPFMDENANAAWFITPSAVSGNITLTASGADFRPFVKGTSAGHEPSGSSNTSKSRTGALFKIVQPLETGTYAEKLEDNYTHSTTENTSWLHCGSIARGVVWYLDTVGTWTGTLEVQRNYTIGAAHGDANWESVYAFQSKDDRNISTDGEETTAEADYRCILTASGDAAENCTVYFQISDIDHVGIVKITGVSSPTSATATVIKTLASTDAAYRWSEGAWSNYRGWPRTIAFYEDRLIFAGNYSQPDTVWGSGTSDYYNFLQGVNDDEPLSFTLSSRQVNVIEWITGKESIAIGTSGSEWTVSGGSDEPLTPSNVKAERQSNLGSAGIEAVLAGDTVLFFQRGAKKLRELAYNWESDSYLSPDMTILAGHVTGDGITNMSFQKVPTSMLWCVRSDGEIALFVYERHELITSWSRIVTDGEFESVAVIPGSAEDHVWVSVKRTIGASDKRYIEYFNVRDFGTDADDAYFVDSGITYDSTAVTTLPGLGHLEDEIVSVLGDGVIQTSKTVAGGQITITSASTVHAGLPFTVHLQTMPLSFPMQNTTTLLGREKRINEVIAQYYNSGDFYVGRDSSDKELLSITGMDGSGVDTDDRIGFPAGWDRYGYIYVYQQSPEPLTLLSLIMEFEVR